MLEVLPQAGEGLGGSCRLLEGEVLTSVQAATRNSVFSLLVYSVFTEAFLGMEVERER